MDEFDAFGAPAEAAPAGDAFGGDAGAFGEAPADFGAPMGEPEAPAGDAFGFEGEPAADLSAAPVEGLGDFGAGPEAPFQTEPDAFGVDAVPVEGAAPVDDFGASLDMAGDAPAAPVDEPIVLGGELAPGYEPPAPAADDAMFGGNGDFGMMGDMGGEVPAAAPAMPMEAAAAPAMDSTFSMDPVEEIEDPVVTWRNANREALEAKDREEAAEKLTIQATATEWLTKFNADRAAKIAEKVASNRETETKSAEEARPMGDTPWERVVSIIDFKFDPGRSKEVSRFKSILFAAKAANPSLAQTA